MAAPGEENESCAPRPVTHSNFGPSVQDNSHNSPHHHTCLLLKVTGAKKAIKSFNFLLLGVKMSSVFHNKLREWQRDLRLGANTVVTKCDGISVTGHFILKMCDATKSVPIRNKWFLRAFIIYQYKKYLFVYVIFVYASCKVSINIKKIQW